MDRSQIALLLSLDDGQGEALAEIVDEYLALSAGGSEALERLLSAGDRGALERTAHTLKGASANVGASGLVEVCAGLETRARQARLQDAALLMEQFDTELTRVRAALEVVMARA